MFLNNIYEVLFYYSSIFISLFLWRTTINSTCIYLAHCLVSTEVFLILQGAVAPTVLI
jgi:hypothetical protein